jgi:subtilisin family serine protease
MYFSSRGPTAAGGMKPDISAPGTWLSAIQLNSAPGQASGLDVMWGTSMASPAAAGAVTLLLDAAKVYNEAHANAPLAIDGRTIRRVLLASARPFDVKSLDTQTNETKNGQYTWVDQGFGMVNLPRAWEILKAERKQRGAAAVSYKEGNQKHPVPLDYQVRVLRKNPNGLAYDGSQLAEGLGDTPEAKFGRGLWLDTKATESLYRVQIARRLPTDVLDREDVGDLSAQL